MISFKQTLNMWNNECIPLPSYFRIEYNENTLSTSHTGVQLPQSSSSTIIRPRGERLASFHLQPDQHVHRSSLELYLYGQWVSFAEPYHAGVCGGIWAGWQPASCRLTRSHPHSPLTDTGPGGRHSPSEWTCWDGNKEIKRHVDGLSFTLTGVSVNVFSF